MPRLRNVSGYLVADEDCMGRREPQWFRSSWEHVRTLISINEWSLCVWGGRWDLGGCWQIWTVHVILEQLFRAGIKTFFPESSKQEDPVDWGHCIPRCVECVCPRDHSEREQHPSINELCLCPMLPKSDFPCSCLCVYYLLWCPPISRLSRYKVPITIFRSFWENTQVFLSCTFFIACKIRMYLVKYCWVYWNSWKFTAYTSTVVLFK